ncbi:unnamed protein product [marine sediment metagenome]|uniref:Uncharacterized protein n=1 Tax=marine sediment metagenome TaxID=412755 RepID=X1Q0B6_9ZZZZ
MPLLSDIKPKAIPATGDFIGTPASIKAKEELDIEAILVEPFEDKISETIRVV